MPQKKMKQFPAYLQVNEKIHSSGQPSWEQLETIGEYGIEAVINLALPSSDNAVAGEAEIVTAQGIFYLQIPADFAKPQHIDFSLFSTILTGLADRTVLIHCAYNKRVSAFLYIYNVLLKMPVHEAKELLHTLWQPDAVWLSFIEEELKKGQEYSS